jgi:hypothetical protein
MYLRTCGRFKSAKSLGPQITNLLFKNLQSQKRLGPQIANPHLTSANLTDYLIQQLFGFVICGTYLRTATLNMAGALNLLYTQ